MGERHDDTEPTTGDPDERSRNRPFGSVAASAIEGIRTLVRQQIELTKIEVMEALAVRAAGVGMIVGAGVLVIYATGFAAAAGASALAIVMPRWAADLLMALLLVGAAATLVLLARRTLRTAPKVDRTPETLKEDARWAQKQIAR